MPDEQPQVPPVIWAWEWTKLAAAFLFAASTLLVLAGVLGWVSSDVIVPVFVVGWFALGTLTTVVLIWGQPAGRPSR